MIYNKLVRDKIPEIIRQNGGEPSVRVLDDREYVICLEKKLDEETGEFHAEKNLEELADILEVVYALTEAMGHSKEELMQVYERKHEARGGFAHKFFLISNEG